MDWITEIIEKHMDTDGKVDLDAVANELKTEFPKNAVPKTQYNAKSKQLDDANSKVQELTGKLGSSKDADEILDEMNGWVKAYQDLAKETQLRDALREAGATDVDFALYLLRDTKTELDKKGNVKDLDKIVGDLKEEHESYFKPSTSGDQGDKGAKSGEDPTGKEKDPAGNKGWQSLDNGLENGKSEGDAALLSQMRTAMGLTAPAASSTK